jgi:hypothetical protein
LIWGSGGRCILCGRGEGCGKKRGGGETGGEGSAGKTKLEEGANGTAAWDVASGVALHHSKNSICRVLWAGGGPALGGAGCLLF